MREKNEPTGRIAGRIRSSSVEKAAARLDKLGVGVSLASPAAAVPMSDVQPVALPSSPAVPSAAAEDANANRRTSRRVAINLETMRAGFKAGITFFLGKPPELARLSGLLRCLYSAMLREKRSYIRLPLRMVVTCERGEHRFTSTSLNISEGGILLESSGGLVLGDEVNLTFSLPHPPGLLNPHAIVVRKEPPDTIALHYVDLTSLDRKAIQDFIAGRVKE